MEKAMIIVILIFLFGMATGYFVLRLFREKEITKPFREKVSEPKYLQLHFENPFYSSLLLRRMSYSPSGGADIGECLITAEKIEEGNYQSWYARWMDIANRINDFGKKCKDDNDLISAKECYLRASNYFQAAESILPKNDNRKLETFKKSREVFQEAMKLFEFPFNMVKIPYESTDLPAYIALADSTKKSKTVIINTGFDGTLEEEYFTVGFFALKRGYNVIMFEGPGQGMLLREEEIPFSPEWEKVISPIMDFADNHPNVDKDKIALYGRSFGGYLAPRAAAHDNRVKALILNSPIIDFNSILAARIPQRIFELLESSPKKFDELMYIAMEKSQLVKFNVSDGMWKLGADTPSEWVNHLKKYDLKNDVERISCPTLVVDSENDDLVPDREVAKTFFNRLKVEKEMIFFSKDEGAGMHCQVGELFYSNEKIFNWLDKIFSKK